MTIAGVMSGTSLDGVDVAIVRLTPVTGKASGRAGSLTADVLGMAHQPYPNTLVEKLLACQAAQAVGFGQFAKLEEELNQLTLQAIHHGLEASGLSSTQLDAVAMHGQTVFHKPPCSGQLGFTWQWGDPATIAWKLDCPVVAQFRQGELAAGGQGAPLVPYAQALLYGHLAEKTTLAFLNLGGIANITVFPTGLPMESPVWEWQNVQGYDTGPANMLLDAAARHYFNQPYDEGGQLAAQGQVDADLLNTLQGHPYYHQPFPKSTGREAFNANYLHTILGQFSKTSPHDVMATLTQLTGWHVEASLSQLPPGKLIVSGGGANNPQLLQAIRSQLMPNWQVTTAVSELATANTAMECVAFTVLGWARYHHLPGNLPACTGATRSASLGGIWCP